MWRERQAEDGAGREGRARDQVGLGGDGVEPAGPVGLFALRQLPALDPTAEVVAGELRRDAPAQPPCSIEAMLPLDPLRDPS